MAGANELMSYLQGVRSQGVFVGVVSNKPHDLIKQEADRFGWHDMLDIIVGSDEVPKRKPNPEPLAVALKDHPQKDSLLPQKIIYIGDTNADADFAKNGGIRFFGVGDKITHDYQAQAQCKDLTQVLSRLKLLFKNPTADRSPGP